MGVRVNKVLGWGLLNIGVDDRYRVTDPRLNPDGLLLNNDRSGQWTTTGLREWAEANNQLPRFGLPRRWDQSGDTELVHCFIMDVEYGLDVLVIRPLSEPKWHRYDDSIDWIEETYVKEPSDRNGDPVAIICGDPSAPIGSPEHKGVIELLWDTFGGTVTATGHRVLDPHIGAIYGDSITETRCRAISENLAANGFASCNMVYGIGSFTYQHVTRDTFGFAGKATYVEIDGVGRAIYKDPITDDGVKRSARGRLAVVLDDDGRLSLINEATAEQQAVSLLQPVWRDGEFVRCWTFDEVRARARA